MHKGIMMLTKAEGREDAQQKISEFLKDYGNGQVWDWYQIGGRWANTLSPHMAEFTEKAEEILKETKGKGQYQSDVEAKQKELQAIWLSIGGTGENPYADHYKMPETGRECDIMPLSECIDIVKGWHQDPIEAGKKELAKAEKRWGEKSEKGFDANMYGYCLKGAGGIFSQDFSFECNVYNIEEYNFSIPEAMNDWYVVMIDIHN
jgi:hypothetical protein